MISNSYEKIFSTNPRYLVLEETILKIHDYWPVSPRQNIFENFRDNWSIGTLYKGLK